MVLTFLRALFILLMAAVGWSYLKSNAQPAADYTWLVLWISIAVGASLICVDILAPPKTRDLFRHLFRSDRRYRLQLCLQLRRADARGPVHAGPRNRCP